MGAAAVVVENYATFNGEFKGERKTKHKSVMRNNDMMFQQQGGNEYFFTI